jgi:arylsulfatase A-like enzyme
VPFILRYPDAFPKNNRVHSPVQTFDLFSTITHLLDIDLENVKQKIQSINLLDVTKYRDDRLIISEYKDQPFEGDVYKKYNDKLLQKFRYASRSVVRSEYKYIWKSNGQNELYHLKNDKDEDDNLINTYQDKVQSLEGELNEWLTGFQSNELVAEEKTDFEADDKIKAQLQALGYL